MKYTMMIAALCCATACVSPEAHRRLQGENDALRAQIAELAEQHQALAARAERLETENKDLGSRAADAAWIAEQKQRLADLFARYGDDSATKMPGVDLVPTSEGYAFRVAGGVLFESGQARLSEGGKRTLNELVETLRDREIRVEGHTDDVKITHSQWATNLRLSIERAMTVADYLIAAGVPKQKVSAAGYGPFRPAVEGTTDEARSKNRRVEIVMLEK